MINSYCLILSVSHSSLDFRHRWCSVGFGKGDSKFPPLRKGTACVACKFQWRNLRSYLSWVMPMTFTWSPPNVSTTSWCQLKSTKEYSPTNASLDQMGNCLNCTTGLIFKTLPKAQRTRGLSSAYQSNFFRSYHKFLQNSWPNLSSESWPRLNFIISWSINSKTMTKPWNLVLKVWTKN